MGADDLRIVIMHGSGAHDERRTLNVLRLVLVGNLCAQSLQPAVTSVRRRSEPEIGTPRLSSSSPSEFMDTPPMPIRWMRSLFSM